MCESIKLLNFQNKMLNVVIAFSSPYRPGVLKDLKTMGSVSLFIFFITLLVLARQVSSFLKVVSCNFFPLNATILFRSFSTIAESATDSVEQRCFWEI